MTVIYTATGVSNEEQREPPRKPRPSIQRGHRGATKEAKHPVVIEHSVQVQWKEVIQKVTDFYCNGKHPKVPSGKKVSLIGVRSGVRVRSGFLIGT